MKRKQPRQRPQQRAANTRRRSTAPGYRRRGAKSMIERGWRHAFTGVHDLNLLPGRRQTDKSISQDDRGPARSGAAKRRARGRRQDSGGA